MRVGRKRRKARKTKTGRQIFRVLLFRASRRESGGRTLSPASVLNSARFASATTAEMAMMAMNTEVNTRHGRSCDHRVYFARKPAFAVASFRSPRDSSSSPVHAFRARGVRDSPGEADMSSGAVPRRARELPRPRRSTSLVEPEGTPITRWSPHAFYTRPTRAKE